MEVLDENGDPCGFASPWFDPDCPTMSGGAFGGLIREFTIESPYELTGSRSRKARDVGCTITNGRRFGRIVVESTGTDRASVEWWRQWVTNRLIKQKRCCGTTMEVWAHCCEYDGKTGKRTLTDVGEFLVKELPNESPLTTCGCVLEILFSAGDLIIETDSYVEGETFDPIEVCLPTCDDGIELVEQEVVTSKEQCRLDVTYYADDVAAVGCLADCETYDPATQFLVPGAFERVEQSTEECCPVGIKTLDLFSAIPAIVPAQPSLYQTQIVDVIANGGTIDCACQPAVQTVRVKNFRHNPECPECPESLRGFACAEQTGVTVTDGYIDLAAMGKPAGQQTWVFDPGAPTAPPAWLASLLEYFECIGQPYDYEQMLTDAQVVNGSLTVIRLVVFDDGRVSFEPAITPGGLSSCDTNTYVWTAAGIDYTGNSQPPQCEGGTDHAAVPVLTPEQAADCETQLPVACLPYIDVVPSTGGIGPCVLINIAADGSVDSITYEINGAPVDLSVDDLSLASFKWGPCPDVVADDACPPFIPPNAPLIVDFTTGEVTSDGTWTMGPGWPYDTDPSQYVIVSTDLGPNNDDPIITTELVPQQVVTDDCPAPCGTVQRKYPQNASDCWPCDLDDEQQITTAKVALSASQEYRPEFQIFNPTGTPMEHLQVFLVPQPSQAAPPDASNVGPYLCDRNPYRVLRLDPGQSISLNDDCLTITCNGKPVQANTGWVAAGSAPYGLQRACDTDCLWLIVLSPDCQDPPVVTFGAELITQS